MDKKNEFIKEAIKMRMLSEYNFYSGDENKLLLDEDDDEIDANDENTDSEELSDDMSDDMGDDISDDMSDDMGDDMSDDMSDDMESMGDNVEVDDSIIASEEGNTEEDDVETEEDDTVEVDITDLTKSNEDMENNIVKMNNMLSAIIDKFQSFENRENDILSSIEQEIKRRNPTEMEKLNMRTLDSYPFNVKPNDYWDKVESEGRYQARPDEEEEYVLKQSDIDGDYNPYNISKSFKSSLNDIFNI